MADSRAFERFKEITSRGDAEIDLVEAALVIAATEYSDLAPSDSSARNIEERAARLKERVQRLH